MEAKDARKAQAQLGNAKEQEIFPITGKKGENVSITAEQLKDEHTLFIKGEKM